MLKIVNTLKVNGAFYIYCQRQKNEVKKHLNEVRAS